MGPYRALCFVGVIAVAAVAQPAGPQDNRALAEHFYRAAEAAGNRDAALVAVRKALTYDANHLSANMLLAELLIGQGQLGQAIAQVARAEALIGRPPAPPEAKARLQRLQDRLKQLRRQAAKWTEMKATFAARYLAVAKAPGTAGMPSKALAFSRAARLKPRDKQLADQSARAKTAIPRLPVPAGRRDPAGAKILCEQAARHLQVHRYGEAAKLLSAAVSLDPDGAKAWCDLGLCHLNQKNSALAAVCLSKARAGLDRMATEQAKELKGRVGGLLARADPGLGRIERIDRQFAALATRLAQQASAAGDTETAGEIRRCLADIPALEAPAGPTRPAVALPRDPDRNLVGKIDFRREAVKISARYARLQRHKNQIVFAPDPDAKGGWCDMKMFLGKATYAGDVRMRWRIEPVGGDPEGVMNLKCWPIGSATNPLLTEDRRSKTWSHSRFDQRYEAQGYAIFRTDNPTAAFREDGVNELCVEKRGRALTIWVNGIRMIQIRFSRERLREAAEEPIWLLVNLGGWKDRACKVTLLSFAYARNLPPNPSFGAVCLTRRGRGAASGNLTARINLAGRDVDFQLDGGVGVRRHKDHFVMSGGGHRTGRSASVTLRNLTFADDTRVRWRIEPVGASGADDGYVIRSWSPPTTGGTPHVCLEERVQRREVVALYCDIPFLDDCKVRMPPWASYKAAFRPNRIYDLCLEKRGRLVSTWLGRTKISELDLSDKALGRLANAPVWFCFGRRGTAAIRVSLVELSVGQPKLPPATVPLPGMATEPRPAAALRDLRGTVDLSAAGVKFEVNPPATPIQRERDHFIVGQPAAGGAPAKVLTVTFGKAVGAECARVRWRIEPFGDGVPAALQVRSWPLPEGDARGFQGSMRLDSMTKAWYLEHVGTSRIWGYNVHFWPSMCKVGFSGEGVYELGFEKEDRFVWATVNSTRRMMLDLSPEQRRQVENTPTKLWLRARSTVPLKVTLLELSVSSKQAPGGAGPPPSN